MPDDADLTALTKAETLFVSQLEHAGVSYARAIAIIRRLDSVVEELRAELTAFDIQVRELIAQRDYWVDTAGKRLREYDAGHKWEE